MARILVVSSFLAKGTVGLMASVPVLQAQGHEVLQLPTVVLSNHPGHLHAAGERVSPELLDKMLLALEANGWLEQIDAVLTGYLPAAAHARFARGAIERVRRHAPRALYVCDPILGDDPRGLYIAEDAAAAIRTHLLPLADVITPNRFELSWLSGSPVATTAQAAAAARSLGCGLTAATSIPDPEGVLTTLLAGAGTAHPAAAPRLPQVPHGTGDVFAALLTGGLAAGLEPRRAFDDAHDILQSLIAHSQGRTELMLDVLTKMVHVHQRSSPAAPATT